MESAGIKDVLTKSLGSANAINVVKATIQGLSELRDPRREIARRRASVGRREGAAAAAVTAESGA
jgi:small subunit ribosomal protein S5